MVERKKYLYSNDILVSSGKGGNGCISFRREALLPKGGPDGGDGGRGGSVLICGSKKLETIADFKYKRVFRAQNGRDGSSNNKTGASGDDLIIRVPIGTEIWRDDELLFDIMDENPRLVAKGGKPGLGNQHFATPDLQVPYIATEGESGEELVLDLVLKHLADVGVIGMPNAGKSTLVYKVSRAPVKIGDYAFSTMEPVLGVVKQKKESDAEKVDKNKTKNDLMKLELDLLKPEVRKSVEELDRLIADDFIEIGLSGVYDKQDLLKALPHEEPRQFEIFDFRVTQLSGELVLVAYELEETIDQKQIARKRGSIRSSLWRKDGEKYQLTFHQGLENTQNRRKTEYRDEKNDSKRSMEMKQIGYQSNEKWSAEMREASQDELQKQGKEEQVVNMKLAEKQKNNNEKGIKCKDEDEPSIEKKIECREEKLMQSIELNKFNQNKIHIEEPNTKESEQKANHQLNEKWSAEMREASQSEVEQQGKELPMEEWRKNDVGATKEGQNAVTTEEARRISLMNLMPKAKTMEINYKWNKRSGVEAKEINQDNERRKLIINEASIEKEIDINWKTGKFLDDQQQNAVDYGEDYAGWNEAENIDDETRSHLDTSQSADPQFASVDGLRKGGRLIVADLPGLLQGSHRNVGLGHRFLQHLQRCSLLLHVVDGSDPNAFSNFQIIIQELGLYNSQLLQKQQLVCISKGDLAFPEQLLSLDLQIRQAGYKTLILSLDCSNLVEELFGEE